MQKQWGPAGVAQEVGSLAILFKGGVTFRLGRVLLMTQGQHIFLSPIAVVFSGFGYQIFLYTHLCSHFFKMKETPSNMCNTEA